MVPLKLVKLAVAPLLVHDLGPERGPDPGGVPHGTPPAHVVRVERLPRVHVAVLDAHLHVKPGDSVERRSKGRDVLGVEVRAGHRQEILELDPDLLPPRVRLEHGVGTEARDFERGVRDLGSPRGDNRVVEQQHHLVDARDEVVLGGQARGGSRRGIGRGVLEVGGDEHRALGLCHDVREREAEHAVVVLVSPRRAVVVISLGIVAVPRGCGLEFSLLVVKAGLVDVGVDTRAGCLGQDVVEVPEDAGKDPRGYSYHDRLVREGDLRVNYLRLLHRGVGAHLGPVAVAGDHGALAP